MTGGDVEWGIKPGEGLMFDDTNTNNGGDLLGSLAVGCRLPPKARPISTTQTFANLEV